MAKAIRHEKVRKFLTGSELAVHGEAICRVLDEHTSDWGAEGYSFVGRSPRIRAAIHVPLRRPNAARPVGPIALPRKLGGQLKPMVVASYSGRALPAHFVTPMPAGLLLAPGLPVFIGEERRRIGFSAVVRRRNELLLLTCGHGFEDTEEELFVEGDDEPVAVLADNFLASNPRLDGALCTVTTHGVDLLSASAPAPTWLRRAHRPSQTDNTKPVVFWPSNTDGLNPIEETVHSSIACTSSDPSLDPLFHGEGPTCGFVEVAFRTHEGDSGSLLTLGDQAYGLCTGHVGSISYFTPITAVLDRASSTAEVVLWHPDDGFPS